MIERALMAKIPDLSVLIVNWNSAHFLDKCLQSIYANTPDLNLEIVVVDNASYDGSQEIVADRFPEVAFIQNPVNEGFARANNQAFRRSNGRYVLFLNPDTEVVGPALAAMLTFLKTTPDAGIVGPKLLNSDRSIQTTSIMRFPSLLNEALDFEFLHRTFPTSPLWDIGPLFAPSAATGVVVEAISGACMMMPRRVFEEVGMFDTTYFMFSEDLDLCYKVRTAGWKTYYCGEAVLIHCGGGSTVSAPDGFRTVMIQAAHVDFIRKRRGRLHAFLYKIGIALVSSFHVAMHCALLLFTLGLFRRHKVTEALAKWSLILIWALHLGDRAATHSVSCAPQAVPRQDASASPPGHRPCASHALTIVDLQQAHGKTMNEIED
jgi:GT2 family glycosyltransferase